MKPTQVTVKNTKKLISEKRRDLMHMAMDGDYDLAGTMYILNGYKNCDNILVWLIINNYTGKNLRDLIVKKFHANIHEMVKWIVERCRGYERRKIT